MAIEKPILLNVPERIETDRLELRAVTSGSGARTNAAVVASIKEVAKYMPWANPTPSVNDTEEWCRQAHAKFIQREQFQYHFFLKGSDAFVGSVGLFNIHWDVRKGEVGYWIHTDHSGRGFMSEAVRAIVKMAFAALKFERLEIRCDEGNERSARVAERCGFKLEAKLRNYARTTQGELRDDRLYSLLPSDLGSP
jgi:RimJ/RimL family protein N-acetyltransferase